MRLIHTSDWHLGQELHGFDRGPEHDAFLAWLLLLVRQVEADALVVTGDIYDSGNPSVPAQSRLYRFLSGALALNDCLQIVLIGGNHDSPGRLELPRDLLTEGRLHVVGALPRTGGRPVSGGTVITLHDRRGDASVSCVAMPFLRAADLPPGMGAAGVRALYAQAVEHARAALLPIIATGHMHLHGGEISELSERRIYVGGEAALSSELFDSDISYVALGHLHKPQRVAGPTLIRYAGSPFPMSVVERAYEHSVAVVDIDDSGTATIDLMPIPRHVAFLRVPDEGSSTLEAVEDQLRMLSIDDCALDRRPFLEVSVQLFTAEPNLRRRIEAALAMKAVRLLRVERQKLGVDGLLADVIASKSDLLDLKPADVFRRLHQQQFMTGPDEELSALFDEVVAAALEPAREEHLA